MNAQEQKKCKDKVEGAFNSRMEDIRKLFAAYCKGDDEEVEDLGTLNEYGLCIDLVEAGTFQDQREDYVRYQLSWGGPAEEFRVYRNGEVEFWYLDWFDGAPIGVENEDADIIKEIIEPMFPDFIRR